MEAREQIREQMREIREQMREIREQMMEQMREREEKQQTTSPPLAGEESGTEIGNQRHQCPPY